MRRELGQAIGQLLEQTEAEADALAQPDAATAKAREWQQRRAELHRLRHGAARWPQVLEDGLDRLAGALEADLVARTAEVGGRADELVDGDGPPLRAERFSAWLCEQLAVVVSEHLVQLQEGAAALARTVAELLQGDLERKGARASETGTDDPQWHCVLSWRRIPSPCIIRATGAASQVEWLPVRP